MPANKRFLLYMLILIVFPIAISSPVVSAELPSRPDYFWTIEEMNKASLVMLTEKGIISRPLASKIGVAINKVIIEGDKPGSQRPADYLEIEALIAKVDGSEISRVHSGRSRQDMQSTSERMFLRESLLKTYESLHYCPN
jgi:argininosuccinate lyase